MSFISAEHVAVFLHCTHFDLTLIVFYCPHRQNNNVFLEELSKVLLPLGRMCLIGDINIDLLKSKTQVTVEYLNTLADAGIAAFINLPTRVELLGNSLMSSCLDGVNVRLHQEDCTSFIIEREMSDYFFVEWSILPQSPGAPRNLCKYEAVTIADTKRIDSVIANYDWNTFLSDVTDDVVYQQWRCISS